MKRMVPIGVVFLALVVAHPTARAGYPFWSGKNVEEDLQVRQKLSISVADYLKARKAFTCEADQKCLEFFVTYLENKEPLIAQDAFAQVVQLPFVVLRDNREVLPSLKLRRYAQDKKLDPVRRDFYAFILGLKKHPSDRNLLAEITDEFFSKEGLQNVSMAGILAGYVLSGSNYAQPMFLKLLRYNTASAKNTPRHALDVLEALEFLKSEMPEIVESWSSLVLSTALERNLELKQRALDLASRWQDTSLAHLLLDHLKKNDNAAFRDQAKLYCESIQDEYCRNVLAWVAEQAMDHPPPVDKNVQAQ